MISRCGAVDVTYMATGAEPPRISTRYTSNVPAGTVSDSVTFAESVSGWTSPFPERNTGTVNVAPGDHANTGSNTVIRLSSSQATC